MTNTITKCVFPAAGYGTRFLPATKAMPKEMLPVLDKPLVQYGVEEALAAGMSTIAIITGRGKRAIADHFDISYELEHQIQGSSKENLLHEIRNLIDQCTFLFTRQREMRGLGDAILCSEPLTNHEPFGVILADDLCSNEDDPVMCQMARLYEEHQCSIVAVQEVPIDEISKYGVIAGEEIEDGIYRVTDMVEKPPADKAPSNLAIIGRYILTPDMYEILRNIEPGKNGEIQLTDAILEQAKQGKVIGYRFKGQRFDCGSIHGFVDAVNHFFSKFSPDE
ncbi:UTP--glucose-1-phosphate uridylyltransferase GalU [Solemya velum gill symbiont]|uniref:UTP--glucose-1-phosphate uridylyltransferase GalU n=1 Tax=Solemya velum gill symbiont TaxID=2340 RepID=UPI000998769C|nr:UTP--glucose-1-phosphate uridylyltransferase GalU [Solemya velum gill symbiont]OOY99648.1 UTP--glucose-1-phosphate uridylyltransferase [Solemya velum gill symbiont]OOZ01830.1 UTP--glucose-1-phosphate uridylyltransferase [Solemya velum gill symbiont]OOZ04169.1 UTP--glucose-1-phosphate uridylyltransferase [Solemya velum gill symbiont]OOZ06411.1 UTP--glucose-1-phosphate uridylyltransferase [Solemya velum gill symbiont]OOZ08585.1 UTP--glucose-1-phosphate uridylyltransferase [Solemya velum gill 